MITKLGQRRPTRLYHCTTTGSNNLVTMLWMVLLVVMSDVSVVCLHDETIASTAVVSEDSSSSNHHHMDDNNNNNNYDETHQTDSTTTPTTTTTTKTTSSSSTTTTTQLPPQKPKQDEGRLWGAAAHEESASSSSSNKIPFVAKPGNTKSSSSSSSSSSLHHTNTIFHDPFAKGFQITTRVYTDLHDKKAHFDDTFMDTVILPYWECGVTGSTTVPIPLQHVQVRHLLGGAKPSSFSIGGGEDNFGPHPQLVVALTPIEIILNSGQHQSFVPGDVILLENVMAGGHKLQGVDTSQNMICMLLTLPNAYHHIGKDKNSLQTIFEKTFWKQTPCKTGLSTVTTNNNQPNNHHRDGNCVTTTGGSKYGSRENNDDDDTDDNIRSSVLSRWAGPPQAIRRVGLGVIGVGLSLALADFLGKCAPFILAVAFGGGALVIGGTYGVVKLGEYGIDEMEIWTERRLLRLQSGSNSDQRKDQVDDDNDSNVLVDASKRIDDSLKLSQETDSR
jgi:hypothetical protein